MIIQVLLAPVWFLLNFIIGLLPDTSYSLPIWVDDAVALLSRGMAIFPVDVWLIFMGNVIFWLGIHMTWAIIEWVYKKIPGID